MMTSNAPVFGHVPVMVNEVIEALQPFEDGYFVDATFGIGGHSKAILAHTGTKVLAIDRDPQAVKIGEKFSTNYSGRFRIISGRFGDLENLVGSVGIDGIDGIIFDLGVSSAQLENSERGFSFRLNGPLDMRMGLNTTTAAELVNSGTEKELTKIIREYGEERQARRIAKEIVITRTEKPILTTVQLAEIIRKKVRRGKNEIDPATKTFMAFRICVNSELDQLKQALIASENILKPNARLAVLSFHSLEDRIVKQFFYSRSGRSANISRYLPENNLEQLEPSFRMIKTGIIRARDSEVRMNIRSRSAKLRVAERTEAASWGQSEAEIKL